MDSAAIVAQRVFGTPLNAFGCKKRIQRIALWRLWNGCTRFFNADSNKAAVQCHLQLFQLRVVQVGKHLLKDALLQSLDHANSPFVRGLATAAIPSCVLAAGGLVGRVGNDNLQQQAQTLFREWFIDNPDAVTWKEGTFSDLIEKIISGDWGKDAPSGNNKEMVYCIRGADIPEVRAGNKGKMPTRYILPKNYAAKQLVDGDIVVEISGGSPTQSTGRAAAVSTALLDRYDKGMVCTNFCKALKPVAGYSMYVYHYWLHLYDMGVFFSYENGTTGIKNLDITGFIETEPILIAPADLVEKFDAFCQSIFAKVYANGFENEQLALIRDTLLPKLMTGEVDVSEIEI